MVPPEKQSIIETLPPELLVQMLDLLSPIEQTAFSRTSRALYKASCKSFMALVPTGRRTMKGARQDWFTQFKKLSQECKRALLLTADIVGWPDIFSIDRNKEEVYLRLAKAFQKASISSTIDMENGLTTAMLAAKQAGMPDISAPGIATIRVKGYMNAARKSASTGSTTIAMHLTSTISAAEIAGTSKSLAPELKETLIKYYTNAVRGSKTRATKSASTGSITMMERYLSSVVDLGNIAGMPEQLMSEIADMSKSQECKIANIRIEGYTNAARKSASEGSITVMERHLAAVIEAGNIAGMPESLARRIVDIRTEGYTNAVQGHLKMAKKYSSSGLTKAMESNITAATEATKKGGMPDVAAREIAEARIEGYTNAARKAASGGSVAMMKGHITAVKEAANIAGMSQSLANEIAGIRTEGSKNASISMQNGALSNGHNTSLDSS